MRGVRAIAVALLVVAVLAVGGVLAVFLFHNDHWVTVRFPVVQLDWARPFSASEWESPLYAVMLTCTFLGMVLATVAYIPLWASRSYALNRDRRFIHGLEQELTDLRNLPVTDPAPFEDLAEEAAGKPADAVSGAMAEDDESALAAALQPSPPSREARETRR